MRDILPGRGLVKRVAASFAIGLFVLASMVPVSGLAKAEASPVTESSRAYGFKAICYDCSPHGVALCYCNPDFSTVNIIAKNHDLYWKGHRVSIFSCDY